MDETNHIAIIGAGPAGLTAAYLLAKQGKEVTIFEADPQYVGGISRTAIYKGFHFDIGGHRFFSKSKKVENLWDEIASEPLMVRPRLSKIYYRNRFFTYPLKPIEALGKLGVFESTLCILSYFKAQVFPVKNPKNFTDWVTNRFGKRLFRIFFETYTEKVWGMKCKDISADWAAQRIVGLSLWTALKSAVVKSLGLGSGKKVIKSSIDTFRYPRLGPGMLWNDCAAKIKGLGGNIRMGTAVSRLQYHKSQVTWEVTCVDFKGEEHKVFAKHVISTAPMRDLIQFLEPHATKVLQHAGKSLRYRDFLTIVLIVKEEIKLPDNWIYIHDPAVKVGRIQNYRAWSPDMVPDPAYSSLGLEYFCFENDMLWSMPDEQLIEFAKKEITKLNLVDQSKITDGCVVRQPKAYPVYDDQYQTHVDTIKEGISLYFPNLHMVGRNGMHKYNNQDHAMMTAMLTVENIKAEKNRYDIWVVNQDAQYHEAISEEDMAALNSMRLTPSEMKIADMGQNRHRYVGQF